MVVGVARLGSALEWRSFGAVSPGGERLSEVSPIYVASVGKQFTAAVIADLALDDVIGLDDGVDRWIPEAPEWWGSVTLAHLVAHTAGLGQRVVVEREELAATKADRVAAILASRPARGGGLEHRYSNDGYVVLAEIAERATGVAFGELAKRRLFEPAGMTESHFVDVGGFDSVPGWADGRDKVTTVVASVGDGGLVSTVADLLAWLQWLPGQPVAALMLADRPVMPNGRTAHDAWGVSIRAHHGQVVHSHGGSVTGYMASTLRFPALGFAFVALANSDHDTEGFRARVHGLVDAVLGEHLDLDQPSLEHTHGLPLEPPT